MIQDLTLRRRIDAAPASVFAAWTHPATMRRWLAPGPCVVEQCENDLRVGGTFRIAARAPDEALHVITGRYCTIEPDCHLGMTWRYAGPIVFLDGVETLLDVRLTEAGSATELVLTQTRIAEAIVREAFEADWPSCFDKLSAELRRSRG